ncbi:hypothetical protein DDZ15_08260 [Rhodohalobacter mucosus]|uniref:Uncharacterized protein n=1 Tax=Rhodohalobacter mucosus TaxID=2079485 RepID=A0A316TU22_9BACT|nr:hypothetical protein DDZ15_08260 [Rhodohalobacter mucosus]
MDSEMLFCKNNIRLAFNLFVSSSAAIIACADILSVSVSFLFTPSQEIKPLLKIQLLIQMICRLMVDAWKKPALLIKNSQLQIVDVKVMQKKQTAGKIRRLYTTYTVFMITLSS